MIKPKKLIVDDDHSISELLQVTLESRGYDVSVDHGVRSGLALACSKTPHVILLDVAMPKKDGLELLKEVRNFHDLSDTPVIMITAKGETDVVAKAMLLEVVDFVAKTFEIGTLVKRVMKWTQTLSE
jgi:DNA-binding response OmpR family regulator